MVLGFEEATTFARDNGVLRICRTDSNGHRAPMPFDSRLKFIDRLRTRNSQQGKSAGQCRFGHNNKSFHNSIDSLAGAVILQKV
jgi:hypothetical protein